MDVYLLTLLLGFIGLTVMAFAGLAGHSHDSSSHDVGHLGGDTLVHDLGHWLGFGHVGHGGHAGDLGHDVGHLDHGGGGHDVGQLGHGDAVHDVGHLGHGGHDAGHGGHDVAHAGQAGHADATHAGDHGHDATHAHGDFGHTLATMLLSWLSPRVIFGVLVGFGAAGMLLRPLLGASLTVVAAVAAGVGFEAGVLGPVWSLMFRFASTPADTLADAWMETAMATTAFDAAGDGLVQIELNGELTQVLARLRPQDRHAGVRVRMGDRVRVEEVNPDRNTFVVAWLGPGEETGSDSPNA